MFSNHLKIILKTYKKDILFESFIREDIQKKTVERVKMVSLRGGGSEKLLNLHHLQMMKTTEGGGSQSNISSLHRTQI